MARNASFVVGYLASHASLNGERVLKEWMEHKINIRLFDLTHEESLFRERVAEEVSRIGDDLDVFAKGAHR